MVGEAEEHAAEDKAPRRRRASAPTRAEQAVYATEAAPETRPANLRDSRGRQKDVDAVKKPSR